MDKVVIVLFCNALRKMQCSTVTKKSDKLKYLPDILVSNFVAVVAKAVQSVIANRRVGRQGNHYTNLEQGLYSSHKAKPYCYYGTEECYSIKLNNLQDKGTDSKDMWKTSLHATKYFIKNLLIGF